MAPLLVYLSSDASARVTGQAIAAGGDRLTLWSHPREVATVLRDGGFTNESVGEVIHNFFLPQLQNFGQQRPAAAT